LFIVSLYRRIKKKSGPVAVTLDTEDDLLHLEEANEVVVIGIFDDAESASAKAFLAAAADDDSLAYAISTSAAVRSKLAVNGDAVVLHKDFDEKRADLEISSSTTPEEISSWAAGNSVPLVQTFTQQSAQKIFKSAIQIHSLFFTKTDADHHESAMTMFTELAKEFRGKTLVVNVPSSEARVMEYFGLTEDKLPALLIADMSGKGGPMKKYQFVGDFLKDPVQKYMNDFFAGELKPSLKSEPEAPEDETGPVVVLKQTSFNRIVIDNNKDVLVEFYAPCKYILISYCLRYFFHV